MVTCSSWRNEITQRGEFRAAMVHSCSSSCYLGPINSVSVEGLVQPHLNAPGSERKNTLKMQLYLLKVWEGEMAVFVIPS